MGIYAVVLRHSLVLLVDTLVYDDHGPRSKQCGCAHRQEDDGKKNSGECVTPAKALSYTISVQLISTTKWKGDGEIANPTPGIISLEEQQN